MIKAVTTGAPVRDPADKTLKTSLNVGLSFQKSTEGITATGAHGEIFVPWGNIAYVTMAPDPVAIPEPESAPVAEPVKVKRGPFGRPLK